MSSLIEFAMSEREGAVDMRFIKLRCSDLSQPVKNSFHLHSDNEISSVDAQINQNTHKNKSTLSW